MRAASEDAVSISDFHEFKSKHAAYTRTARTMRLVKPATTRRARLRVLKAVMCGIVQDGCVPSKIMP